MAHNHLIQYVNWDKICIDDLLNANELEELLMLCKKENIEPNKNLPLKSKKLLLSILENTDGVEVVNVTKEQCKKTQCVIDLSMDDDEDSQIIDLTEVYERQVILSVSDNTNIGKFQRIPDLLVSPLSPVQDVLRPVIIDGNNIAFS